MVGSWDIHIADTWILALLRVDFGHPLGVVGLGAIRFPHLAQCFICLFIELLAVVFFEFISPLVESDDVDCSILNHN